MGSTTLIAGRYEVLRPLAAGGMGSVVVARQIGLERDVALKQIRPDRVSPELRERFVREAQALGKLRHRNVVAVHDFGDDGAGGLFLAMELVDGETLRAALKRRGRFAVVDALTIAAQICDGLAAVHEAGVVHRDIKPENVVLGKGGAVTIVDFGVARSVDVDDARITRGGAVVGTPGYLAPESVLSGIVDGRADLYAVGAVLYELLTASFAFDGTTASSIVARQLTEPPPPARAKNADVPAAVDDLVARLLDRDPEKRPRSAREVAASLSALSSSSSRSTETATTPVPTATPSPPAQTPQPTLPPTLPPTLSPTAAAAAHRSRAWVAGSLAVGVVAIGAFLLVPRNNALAVSTQPQRAHIMIDGADTGHTTPWTFESMEGGRAHSLYLALDGYRPLSTTFDVTAGRQSLSLLFAPDVAPVWNDVDRAAFRLAKARCDEDAMRAVGPAAVSHVDVDVDLKRREKRREKLGDGWRHLEAGDPGGARIVFENALMTSRDEGERIEAKLGLAGLAYGANAMNEAVALYDDVEDARPDDDVAHYLSAGVHARSGDVEGAVDRLEIAVDSVPSTWLLSDRDLASLAGMPRFEVLLVPRSERPATTTTTTASPTATTTTTTTTATTATTATTTASSDAGVDGVNVDGGLAPIAPGAAFRHASERHTAACNACHLDAETCARPIPRHEACASCHSSSFYQQPLDICVHCHDGARFSKDNKLRRLSRPLGERAAQFSHARHASSACIQCHKRMQDGSISVASHPSCCTCHATNAQPAMSSCSTCHTGHAPTPWQRTPYAHVVGEGDCERCHLLARSAATIEDVGAAFH